MPTIETSRSPSPADKQLVRELFYKIPLLERGKPLLIEMTWVLLGRQNPEQHEKILPDYCYNIFDVFLRTYFKGFPLFSETVQIIDPAGMESAKTVEAAKKVIRLDWRNLGRMCGIAARCIRFAEKEAEKTLVDEGFDELTAESTSELLMVICGRQWVEMNQARIDSEPPHVLLSKILNEHVASCMTSFQSFQPNWTQLAYEWSPEAMIEFSEGFSEGLNGFLDVQGEMVGGSPRSGIYDFLLVAWPEIKAMLESAPEKRTLTDLHEWMKPFMRAGVTAYIEIETLRDVCAPSPSGIGLVMRPLKSRPSSA